MQNRAVLTWLCMLVVAAFCGSVTAEVVKVTREEEKAWLYHALPLPHRISISGKRIVPPGGIAVSLRANAGPVERNAAEILRNFIKARTGVVPSGKDFEIVMGVLDRDGKVCGISLRNADKLKGFPNSDQAYIIEPAGKTRLVIGALDPKGIFYGMHTLRQLLAREINRNAVAVPMAHVEDWPDFANRGLWNNCLTMYPELSMVKLNYAKNYWSAEMLAVQAPAGEDGQLPPLKKWHPKPLPRTKALYEDGRRYAFHNIPNMTHINLWQCNVPNIFRMYPDLGGKGDTAYQYGKKRPRFRAPCASNPMTRKIIADTLMLFADAGIMEVSVWTTEYYSYCSCPNCLKDGKGPRQFILEARAIIGARNDVRKKHPDFKVRLFGIPLSLYGGSGAPAAAGTADAAWDREMPTIMAELPKDVILESVYTIYRTDKTGKRYAPVLDKYAAKGYRIVEYTAAAGILYDNFRALPKIRARIINRYEAKWYGVLRWSMFSNEHEQTLRFASHDIDALAEWGWNAKGRTVSEFIRAWATISGFDPPEPVMEWIKYAMKWDGKYNFDRRSAKTRWLEAVVRQLKSGKPLSMPRWCNASVDHAAALKDLTIMLTLSRTINKEYTLRTKNMISLYNEMAAITNLVQQDSRKADSAVMIEAAQQLAQAIDERGKAFDAMTELFGGVPNIYKKADFEGQRLIIKNEMLPLMSKLRR